MSENPTSRRENFTYRFKAKTDRKKNRAIDGSRAEPKLGMPEDFKLTKPVERARPRVRVVDAVAAVHHDVPDEREIGAWIKNA